METIQVLLDSKLLAATDRAAKKMSVNRSALIRDAVRSHLERLRIAELEERDRAGYKARAPQAAEVEAWEREALWPPG
jgi:metal-responsive CopG/Arc/MetJ family transcriptional regulator